MQTETVSSRFRGLDTWPTGDILDAFLEGQLSAVAAVRPALAALGAAADAAAERLAAGDGRLVYVGAGTSGRIGVQDGVELLPTFGWPAERLLYLLAGGEPALLRSVEGAEDDAAAGAAAVERARLGAGDVVLGLAASGTTAFTIAALKAARAAGAQTIGIANSPGAPLLDAAEHPILLDTGAEAIAGSTRMKAGTAQKAALNLFSTLVMVRLGHVHDGLMVDLVATNAKLARRAEAMVVRLAACSAAQARAALAQTGGRVKPAVLVARGLSADAARALLAAHGGRLRDALAAG